MARATELLIPWLALSLAAQEASEDVAPPARPHVVLIVAADAGYADFSIHGATDVATSRIDSIAANGVRCTNGYVSGCVCSPSRAGLMTGRYQQRFGHETNIPPRPSEENGLPIGERTVADELRGVGYRTIALGKWHLGYAPHFHPTARGFDAFYGFLQGARPYWPLEQPTQLNRMLRDREPVEEAFDYLTDELAREAVRRIEARGEQPLFVYLAFNAVHTPMHATPADLEGASGPPRRRRLVAMTRALDRAVGAVLDALEREGLRDDTLLVFVNDNGGATNNAAQNGPLRGHKGQMFEGGIRVPFLMQWPRRLPKGRVYDEPVIALDLLPTFLAAAGAAPDGERRLDGVDLLPYLAGEREAAPHDALFWRHGEHWAVREGAWKLVRQGDGEPMLFDLGRDVGERQDRAAAEPERAAALERRWRAWAAELATPRWGFGDRRD